MSFERLGVLPESDARFGDLSVVDLIGNTPLIRLTKAQIIQQGLALGVNFALTSSCYDPAADGAACGRCDSCSLRLKGFREAGKTDPRRYAIASADNSGR